MRRAFISTIIALLSLGSTVFAQPHYQMVNLGDFTPTAISRDGTIVGVDRTSSQAALLTDEGLTDLGTLGGESSGANGINAKATVVGSAEDANAVRHGFMWTAANGMQALADTPSATWARAAAINDSGVIVGRIQDLYEDGSQRLNAVRWGNGSPQVLGSDPESADANAINKPGFIGGALSHAAVVWRPNGSLVNLGTFGWPDAAVVDLNDRNVALIVVHQDVFPYHQTSLWRNGQLQRLSPIPGSYDCNGTALNNSTVIVGQCYLNETPPSEIPLVGAVWVDNVAYNLNAIVDNIGLQQITGAWDINDQGEIVATAQAGETQYGVLLIPQQ
jgi:probable HAF family extracellular repeat protein